MLAGVSLAESIEACSGGRKRATSERDLRQGLDRFGFTLGRFERWPSRTHFPDVFASTVMLRVRRKRHEGYHWIVEHGEFTHDPEFVHPLRTDDYRRRVLEFGVYATSFAVVEPGEELARLIRLGWSPMMTAPRDGRPVLLYVEDSGNEYVGCGRWHPSLEAAACGAWVGATFASYPGNGWMTLGHTRPKAWRDIPLPWECVRLLKG